VPVGELDDVEDLVDGRGGRPAVQAGQEFQVPAAGQAGVELGALDEPGDPVQGPDPVTVPRPAEHLQGAGVRADQPEQHPQESGLTGAVRAQHAVDLALRDPHSYRVDRGQRSVGFGQANSVDRQDFTHRRDGKDRT